MNPNKTNVKELSAQWYYEGVELKLGYRVRVKGLVWQVVGIGKSPSESRTPYLWLQNESQGTIIYAPSLSGSPSEASLQVLNSKKPLSNIKERIPALTAA